MRSSAAHDVSDSNTTAGSITPSTLSALAYGSAPTAGVGYPDLDRWVYVRARFPTGMGEKFHHEPVTPGADCPVLHASLAALLKVLAEQVRALAEHRCE